MPLRAAGCSCAREKRAAEGAPVWRATSAPMVASTLTSKALASNEVEAMLNMQYASHSGSLSCAATMQRTLQMT
eukprot:6204607-Pleurochrysis_carterae.AAC.1